jgi:hypothetical protein
MKEIINKMLKEIENKNTKKCFRKKCNDCGRFVSRLGWVIINDENKNTYPICNKCGSEWDVSWNNQW